MAANNDSENLAWGIAGVLFIIILILLGQISTKNQELSELQDTNNSYSESITEANDKIQTQNESIEEAKSQSSESYDDQQEAIDNLEVEDEVSEP